MMKRLLLLFLVPALALAGIGPRAAVVGKGGAGVSSSSAVCSPPQGNLLNDEGFQTPTTGYQQSGWNTATGSPDPVYSITGLTTNKPNGSCTQGFRSNYSSSGVFNYNSWDSGGSNSSTVYARWYLYINSHSISTSDTVDIAAISFAASSLGPGNANASIRLQNTGGVLSILAHGASDSTSTNISTGQWYLVEMKMVPNATSEIKINGGTALTFTSTGYTSWRSIGVGTFNTSSDAFTFNDCVWDLVAADSTGYIGATP